MIENKNHIKPNYNKYGTHLKKKYNGQKVFKVIVDGGFTCPNRDGSKGFGGCTYCNVDSFTPSETRKNNTISDQIERNMERAANRYKADKFIIYFQPNSNTYAPVDELKKLYDKALSVNSDKIVGLSVGTRCDCLDDEKLELFEDYSKTLDVDLEIGMESMYNKTLHRLNRGHSHEEFLELMEKCRNRAFETCVHTIFGLPGENKEMMMKVAEQLNELPIRYVKLHHLYIVKGSVMGVQYKRKPFKLFSLEEYSNFLCSFIPKLRPDMIIQRLFGISDYKFHIAPNWGLRKSQISDFIDKKFLANDIFQGSEYKVN